MEVDPALLRATDLTVAVALVGCGLVAWRWSRPVAALLAATAIAWVVPDRWEVALFWHRALLAHLVLAYPGWRPATRPATGLIAASYVVCVLFPALLLDDAATVASGVLLAAAAWWNARTATGRGRHQRRTALTAGACLGAAMVVAGATGLASGRLTDLALLAYEAGVVAAAVVLVAGLRPPTVDEVAGLVIELGTSPADALRDAIARATRDPDVRVGYWDARAGQHLAADGTPVDPDEAGPDRATVVVEDDTGPLAVVVVDAALSRDPRVVASLETAVRVVVVNTRRTADVVARVRDVEESRRRLVDAAADERAVLDAELRTGVLADIALLAEEVRHLGRRVPSEHLATAAGHLEQTAGDLVDVAAGLRPRDLAAGLGPALARLAATSPVPVRVVGEPGPLPPAVELTAWYVCSEALANAAKHARASVVEVSLTYETGRLRMTVCDDGVGGAEVRASNGLAGLRDRVTSYGGRLTVTSGPSGTTLVAELPLDDQRP
jgi:signal transduction histidine kinase